MPAIAPRLQLRHAPVQVDEQQTPSAHCPDAQSLPAAHDAASICFAAACTVSVVLMEFAVATDAVIAKVTGGAKIPGIT